MYASQRYAIDENNQGVTVTPIAAVLTAYAFRSSQRQVFSVFDASIDSKFGGVIDRDSKVEVVYPAAFKLDAGAKVSVSCRAIIDSVSSTPACKLDAAKRMITMTRVTNRRHDLTQAAGGRGITLVIKSLFFNPASEEPVDAGFSVFLKDASGSAIANYNASKHQNVTKYRAKAISVQQFKVSSKNQVTGSDSEVQFTFAIKPKQYVALRTVWLRIELPKAVGFTAAGTVSCRKKAGLQQDPQCRQETLATGERVLTVQF